jgi:adenosylhomocysteine nucleosidase
MQENINIGLIVAVEISAVKEKYGEPIKQEKINAYNVMTYKIKDNTQLFVIHSGAGQIAAAAATQFLISKLNCSLILNFGIVGGLTPEMSEITTCVVDKIIHYDFDTSEVDEGYTVGRYSENIDEYIPVTNYLVDQAIAIEPTLKRVIVASGDKFIGKTDKKAELHNLYNADICEMESAGIALTCNRNNVPFLMVKCVSDGCGADPKEYYTNFTKSASLCFEILDKIIKNIM